MNEVLRINAIRGILYAIVSLPNHINKLLAYISSKQLGKTEILESTGISEHQSSSCFVIQGRRVCRDDFVGIFHISISTLTRYMNKVARDN